MGFNNPDLRTSLNIYGNRPGDVANARGNALRNQHQGMQNQLMGKQVQNYDQDRARALTDKGVMDKRAGHIFMSKVMGSEIGLEEYVRQQPELVGQFGVPAELAPDLPAIQAEAAKNGVSVETAFAELKKAYTPQGAPSAGTQLSVKDKQEIDYYDETKKRWMVKKQRFNPATQKWETYSDGPKSKLTKDEREDRRLRKNLPLIRAFNKKNGPMKTYADGWKMNDEGTVYEDAEGKAVKLPSFWTATGKRGNIKSIISAGENLDDSIEVMELLRDPEVVAQMKGSLSEPGIIQRIGNMGKNALRKWAQSRGIGEDTKAYEVLIRLQRMASEERKRLLGAAVTLTEVQSVVSWLPDASDNFESIVAKMNVGVYEAVEGLTHWLDVFKHDADMSPFYRAFGWDRFNMPDKNQFRVESSPPAAPPAAPAAPGGDVDMSKKTDAELMEIINGRKQ